MQGFPSDKQAHANAFARLFFMVILFALFGVVRFMVWTLVVFQFLAHVFTGRVSERFTRWGEGLSVWVYKMMRFMTYNTERMPFPFHTLWNDLE
jgi:hypothetical protein